MLHLVFPLLNSLLYRSLKTFSSQHASVMGEGEEELSSAIVSASAPSLTREKFQPGIRFYLAFGSLAIVILAAALDATSLSVALPVRLSVIPCLCDG